MNVLLTDIQDGEVRGCFIIEDKSFDIGKLVGYGILKRLFNFKLINEDEYNKMKNDFEKRMKKMDNQIDHVNQM